ncbi:MAG: purine-binding chemotaxis protein CheW [Betaproteobacteria bacterium]|nr:purine-binding chemotaxis protein CheW [Betaproteobacteria bacterium]
MNHSQLAEIKATEKFLLFRFQGELYGTVLNAVREVVPFQTPRAVPNTKKNFLGIVNLRGEIVSVIDLRLWFTDEKQNARRSTSRALVVVESSAGVVGVAVDQIEGVCQLDKNEIESPTGMPGEIAAGGMVGIGKFRQGLATLLDLNVLCGALVLAPESRERLAG